MSESMEAFDAEHDIAEAAEAEAAMNAEMSVAFTEWAAANRMLAGRTEAERAVLVLAFSAGWSYAGRIRRGRGG